MATLQPLIYSRGFLQILNQLLLPLQSEYETVKTCEDGFHQIKTMKIRGAPAIAITAALSLAVELANLNDFNGSVSDMLQLIDSRLDYLSTSRPTAVNLHHAVRELKHACAEYAKTGANVCVSDVVNFYISEAERMMNKDVSDNESLSLAGVEWLKKRFAAELASGRKLRVLTHCNTGALATVRYGTALGIIRFLHKQGLLEHVYATETRPYNQGARLTIYELHAEGIPATLICDSAVAFLMKNNRVDVAIVGADRVCRNGDTANKVGTYAIGIAAQYHNLPLLIAAPSTSIDCKITDGSFIPIEERPDVEILFNTSGARVVVEGAQTWNPSFDVTSAQLITAVVTEKGVADQKTADGVFNMEEFLQSRS